MSLWSADGNGQGPFEFTANFPAGVINRNSVVFASICEMGTIAGDPNPFPWFGAAALQIDNIVPRDTGDVAIMVNVLWDSPLNFRVFYQVF